MYSTILPTSPGEACAHCEVPELHEPIFITNPSAESLHLTTWENRATRDPRKIVENWHNDNHLEAFRFCDLQPCHAVNSVRK